MGINYGTKQVFNPKNTIGIQVDSDSETNSINIYSNTSPSVSAESLHASVSGTSITFGSEVSFYSGSAGSIAVEYLSSTKFVVVYYKFDSISDGYARIGTISGSTITYGAEQILPYALAVNQLDVCKIDTDKFVVVYNRQSAGYGYTTVGSVSGTTITFGSFYIFTTDEPILNKIVQLDTNKFVLASRYLGDSSYGKALIGTVSGTTVSYGSIYTFNSALTANIDVAAFDTSKFIICFRDFGNSEYGTAIIGDVSGTAITFGTKSVFNLGEAQLITVDTFDSSTFAIAWRDIDGIIGSQYGVSLDGRVSGTTMTFESPTVFNPGGTSAAGGGIYLSSLTSDKFILSFQDSSNSNYGSSIIGNITVPAEEVELQGELSIDSEVDISKNINISLSGELSLDSEINITKGYNISFAGEIGLQGVIALLTQIDWIGKEIYTSSEPIQTLNYDSTTTQNINKTSKIYKDIYKNSEVK